MTSTDTWRRAVSLVLAVLCFLAVPQVAQAVFSGQVRTPGTSVKVQEMAPVTAFAGSLACDRQLLAGRTVVRASINGLSDAGQLPGTTYSVTISGDGPTASSALAGRTGSVQVDAPYALFSRLGFQVTVTAHYGRAWSKSLTRDVSCPSANEGSTPF
ncbi:hypothetical protein [Nocardioides abyssi]|uniref:Uncharacterized protein n=1 Tax=Nocardioides abyssi TaxID=3058370 RepID=A0ABT8EUZ5_9ACTN|nr:hypothetical protein [Nocardioides abyssi]MDN4161801.1 hypothetical protein [Nocardioides abyssi]